MTRPLRYRTELGINQWKPRPEPLTLETLLGAVIVVGFTLFLVVIVFNLGPK